MSVIAHFVFDDYAEGVPLASRVGAYELSAETHPVDDSEYPRDKRWRSYAKFVEVPDGASFDLNGNTAAANIFPGTGRIRTFEFIANTGGLVDDRRDIIRIEKPGDPETYFAIYIIMQELDVISYLHVEAYNGDDFFQFRIGFEMPPGWHYFVVSMDLENETVTAYSNDGYSGPNWDGAIFDLDDVFDFENDTMTLFGNAGTVNPVTTKAIELMVHDIMFTEQEAARRYLMFNAIKARVEESNIPPG